MKAAPAPAASRWGEQLTVLILLAMACALAWMNVSLARRRAPPRFPPFDLKNPMLDVRPRECVESYSPATPHDVICFRSVEDGVVLRPAAGPDRRAGHDGLKRALPYLVVELHRPESGSGGCASGRYADEPRLQFYPLSHFGIPADTPVRLDSIEAQWTESGGRDRLVYVAVLEDYRQYYWMCFVDPGASLTGLVRVDFSPLKARARAQQIYYRDISCP